MYLPLVDGKLGTKGYKDVLIIGQPDMHYGTKSYFSFNFASKDRDYLD